jgi:hypothetical protein
LPKRPGAPRRLAHRITLSSSRIRLTVIRAGIVCVGPNLVNGWFCFLLRRFRRDIPILKPDQSLFTLNHASAIRRRISIRKNFGKIAMNADVDLTAINTLDPTIAYSATQRALLTPFNGMLYYQRRANTEDMAVKAKKNATTNTSGSIYAKWAKVDVGGTDPVMTQVVVGSLSVGGKTVLTINFNNSGVKPAQAPQVFLVN